MSSSLPVGSNGVSDPLRGNFATHTNTMTHAYAQRYFDDFCQLFEITGNGSLRSTLVKLHKIEDWFNRSYVLISLISGIPLDEVRFNYDLGKGKIANRNANAVSMLHIYAVSYAVLLRMAFTLNRDVPEQYRPDLRIVEAANEDE